MKKRITCSEYCPLWDSDDCDCEIYGSRHIPPRHCALFKEYHHDTWAQIQKNDKEEKLKNDEL